MQIYKALNTELLHGKDFPMGAIILTLDNKTQLVCWNFHQSRNKDLRIFVWLPTDKKWVKTYAKNKYTEIMWDYYRRTQLKKDKKHTNYAGMMRHERKHKSGGGGGTRIYDNSITDVIRPRTGTTCSYWASLGVETYDKNNAPNAHSN